MGWVANRLRAYITNPMNFVIYMMTIPFIAFLLSESIEISEGMKGSGVVAVVVSAFYLTYYGVDTIKPQNRFYGLPIWAYMSYLMNGAIFVLVGVQLPEAWQNISEVTHNNSAYSQSHSRCELLFPGGGVEPQGRGGGHGQGEGPHRGALQGHAAGDGLEPGPAVELLPLMLGLMLWKPSRFF